MKRGFLQIVPILIGLLLIGYSSPLKAQCYTIKDRMLMIGDSWYGLMWAHQSYPKAFDKYGFTDMAQTVGGPVINGATLELAIEPASLLLIEQAILANPQLDIVGISLSGNDFLGGWSEDMFNAQENAFFNGMKNDLNVLVNRIKQVRPSINIFFSGYDYINLVETRLYPGSPYNAVWENMGEPTVSQVNYAMARMEQLKINLANADPNIHYVQSMGLMQHIYGYPIGLPEPPYIPFSPGLSPLPGQEANNYLPYPGGVPQYPSPMIALSWGGFDGIHLTEEAYQHLADHQTKHFFNDFFRAYPDATFAATSGESGWVSGNGQTGNATVKIGETSDGNGYKGVLSFNTASLPDDAVIEKASLFLTRSGLQGQNPFLSELGVNTVEIINGTFGTASLESSDFNEVSDHTTSGCFIGSVAVDGYKIRVDLSAEALAFINTSGATQLRIGFDNGATNIDALMDFSASGGNAPLLDVHYTTPTRINESALSSTAVNVYPNPSSGTVNVVWNDVSLTDRYIKVYNSIGELMIAQSANVGNRSQLDMSNFAKGTYLIQIITEQGELTKKLLLITE
jgi:lysophospholipase L1-like esterase